MFEKKIAKLCEFRPMIRPRQNKILKKTWSSPICVMSEYRIFIA